MSAQAYCDLIERTGEGCYYLWGPIQNALLMEFRAGNDELLAAVTLDGSLTDEGHIPALRKDLITQVLIIAGQEPENNVEEYLYSLAIRDKRWRKLGSQRSWIETKKIVAQVSGKYGAEEPLLALLQDKDEEVRRTAVGATFNLWYEENDAGTKGDDSVGIKILQILGDPSQFSRLILPSKQRLQSCFELTLSILFDGYDDPATTDLLLDLWKKIIQTLLWHSDKKSTLTAAGRVIRTTMLKVALRSMIVIVKRLEEERSVSVYSARAVEDFFRSSQETKDRFSRLVPYIDSRELKLEEAMADLRDVALSRDLLSGYLLMMIFSAQLDGRPSETTAIMDELVTEALKEHPGMPSIVMINMAAGSDSDGKAADEINQDLLDLNEKIIKQYQIEHDSICEISRKSDFLDFVRTGKRQSNLEFIYSGLTSYPGHAKAKYNDVNAHGILDVFMKNALSPTPPPDYDIEKIHNYIANVATPGHPRYRDMSAVLDAFLPVLKIAFSLELDPEEMMEAQAKFQAPGTRNSASFMQAKDGIPKKHKEIVIIQEELIHALASIKVYAPDEVDEFMARQNLPRDYRKRVNNRVSEEPLATVIKGRSTHFVRDEIMHKPGSKLHQIFQDWLELAPQSKDLAQWLGYILTMVLNELSGAELFE